MVEYMSDRYDNLTAWQQDFLYTTDERAGKRNQFWATVLKKTLHMLSDNTELYEDWLGISNKRQRVTKESKPVKDHDTEKDDSESRLTNGDIKQVLADLLRQPIKEFFSHPVTKSCLRRITNNKQKLPFLFIIDEAAYLFQTNYNHTFMWVLDQPVVQVLNELYLDTLDSDGLPEMPTDRFFVLMLGTHSQISHFAPNIFPSERLAGNPQLLPSPFLSFNWDENVKEFRPPFKLRDSESLFELVNWGRSMWAALFEGRSNSDALRRCINYVKKKLEPADKTSNFHRELSILAVMSIRLHLDLDCAAPTRASLLVCSKMRWLADVGIFRTHVTTTYGSEPMLVEAAACMMNSYDDTNSKKFTGQPPFVSYICEMVDQLSKGYIGPGDHGELTARILRM